MSFREKVKGILEGKKITMAHPESQKAGTQGPEGAIKVSKSEVNKYLKKGWVRKSKLPPDYVDKDDPVVVDGKTRMTQHEIKRKSKRSSTNEDSNHPFYQKVKALSSGKKSQSLLEKKSKTIKLLIGKITPCGKKSKMDEMKKPKKSKEEKEKQKQQSELVKKGKKSWDERYADWTYDKMTNPQDYRTSQTTSPPSQPEKDEGYKITFFPKKKN